MQAKKVTVPMTRKDEHNNVFEYRIVPLVFGDKRFQTVLAMFGRSMRVKFMKLYNRVSDARTRTPAIEMSSWLAVFTAQQLFAWRAALMALGQDKKTAGINTFKVFEDVFKMQLGGEDDKEKEVKSSPEAVNDTFFSGCRK